jgi:hypothetical protein
MKLRKKSKKKRRKKEKKYLKPIPQIAVALALLQGNQEDHKTTEQKRRKRSSGVVASACGQGLEGDFTPNRRFHGQPQQAPENKTFVLVGLFPFSLRVVLYL